MGVGDWVLALLEEDGPATIVHILPRRTEFVRRKAGTESQEQVVAANVDTVCLVSSMNLELNPRRIAIDVHEVIGLAVCSLLDQHGERSPEVQQPRDGRSLPGAAR